MPRLITLLAFSIAANSDLASASSSSATARRSIAWTTAAEQSFATKLASSEAAFATLESLVANT
jgi:hypothetical protein